jgi:hypothetical protein
VWRGELVALSAGGAYGSGAAAFSLPNMPKDIEAPLHPFLNPADEKLNVWR